MIDATGMPQTAVVIGGNSDIALEVLRRLAARRLQRVLLAGRDRDALKSAARKLRALGVLTVETDLLDVEMLATLDGFASEAASRLGEIDFVLVAAGALGTADLDRLDAGVVGANITTNFAGPAAVTMALANVLRRQGTGRIVVLSSVAGVRVRRANFVYGSAKAGLDGFALGLAEALRGSGVGVMVVRPGFVRTRMTAGLPAAPFSVEVGDVAAAVVRGLETGRSVLWVPPMLGPLFGLLRLLPASLWRRLPA